MGSYFDHYRHVGADDRLGNGRRLTMLIVWAVGLPGMVALSAYTNNPWWVLAYLGGSGVAWVVNKLESR